MTLPELFAAHFERTGGDLMECFRAVLEAEAANRRRPAVRAMKSPEWVEERARRIMSVVAARAGMTASTLLGRDQSARVSRVRQDAMLMVHELTDLGPWDIGQIFKRDHSTVIHGCKAARARLVCSIHAASSLRSYVATAMGVAAVDEKAAA